MTETPTSDELGFQVVNVVGSGRLPNELDLDELKENLGGDTSETNNAQSGVKKCYGDPRPLVIFYESGKYIIISKSWDEVHEAKDNVVEDLEEIGMVDDPDEVEFSVPNVVGKANLNRPVRLEKLAIGLGLEEVEYEPAEFPALIYRAKDYNCTFMLFANGKILTPGATTKQGARESVERFVQEIEKWS